MKSVQSTEVIGCSYCCLYLYIPAGCHT